MKLIKDSWETGDTCSCCGHDGMSFHCEGWQVAPELYDEGEMIEFWGILACSHCGEGQDSDCRLYQVPKDCIEVEA